MKACAVAVCVVALWAVAMAAPPAGISWVPTFRDDFSGTQLDTMKWHPHDMFCGTRNNELQAYIPGQVSVAGGQCRMLAEKKDVTYAYCGQPAIAKQYASGVVVSIDKFDQKYGYFEASCRSPSGRGLWPAFWLLPYDKWPPEIDILEILGHEPDRVHMTNHWGVLPEHFSSGNSYKGPDFSAALHTFGVLWRPDSIIWYVDGVVRHRSGGGVPQEPMYILLNLAVGGDWPGAPDAGTVFPCSFDVDYVAVWQFPDSLLQRFNKRPLATITSPSNGAVFTAPVSTTIRAAVSDSDGTVRTLVVRVNGNTLRTLSSQPWETSWSTTSPGIYAITAVAVDDSGAESQEARVSVRVTGSDGNLIVNGEFDSGTDEWRAWNSAPATGTFAAVSAGGLSGANAGRITMNTAGTADWHYQITQSVPLVQGDTMEVWFQARATATKQIGVMFQQDGAAYRVYWSSGVQVSTSAATYGPIRWVSTVTDPSAGFKFLVGADSADIWLDNVRVYRRPALSGSRPQKTSPLNMPADVPLRAFDLAGRLRSNSAAQVPGLRIVMVGGGRSLVRVGLADVR